MRVQNIDMEKYRMKALLDEVTTMHHHCDGRCALGECICPEEGWEMFTEKRMIKMVLDKCADIQRQKKGIGALIEWLNAL